MQESSVRHVLFIAYLFPPHGGGGVQRTVKFARYLPCHGWLPTVVTTSAPAQVQDSSLMAEVSPGTSIVRVRGMGLPRWLPWRVRHWVGRWFLIVDEQIGWLPFAARRSLAVLREGEWKALYSTSAPVTDHLVALRLKRACRLPWVADFRDPWLSGTSEAFATPLHRALCARLERQVVTEADRVVVVTEPMRQQFLRRHPSLPPGHFVTLPNGFDPADLDGIQPAPRDERLTIVYSGSLYGQRSARAFLSALRDALDTHLIPRSGIAVRFVGNTGHEAELLAKKWQLEHEVTFTGYLPHAEMVAHLLAADVLLLIVGGGPGSDAVLTGKIFEYLACSKPILALVPEGAAAELLREARIGRIVPPEDAPSIVLALSSLYSDWREGQLRSSPDAAVVSRYDRRSQAGDLARLLNEAAAGVRG